jgi:hypothetical protein
MENTTIYSSITLLKKLLFVVFGKMGRKDRKTSIMLLAQA